MKNGLTKRLAQYVVAADYAKMPAEVIHSAKRCLIDWLGVALGGALHPGVESLLQVADKAGCASRATIIGRKRKTDMLNAALINGYMSHVLDYDDTNLESFVHPSAPVWPAICALSTDMTVSGEAALLAFVMGYEVENRIGRVLFRHHDERGWHMSGMVGGFGAAAAVGKILALNVSQMRQAFGIAATYASGLREMFGTMSKSLHPGKAAMSGLYAALLVQAGFTSSENVLETPRGFFAVNAGEDNLEALLDDIGHGYGILKNSVKPYSCGVVIHPTVDGIISLRNREKIKPHEILKIEAEVHPMVPDVTGKTTPQTGIDGKFSIYHCMAVALVDGACGPDQFTDMRVHADDIVSIRKLTSIRVNPDFRHEEARVIIHLKDGRKFEWHVPHASGTPHNPVTDGQLVEKYMGMAGKVIGADKARALADTIWMLEETNDFQQVIDLTTPGQDGSSPLTAT